MLVPLNELLGKYSVLMTLIKSIGKYQLSPPSTQRTCDTNPRSPRSFTARDIFLGYCNTKSIYLCVRNTYYSMIEFVLNLNSLR